MTKVVALVPMRHHSVRVPGKNYRQLAGKPLFHHILESLLASTAIDQVAVDTDSPIIIESLTTHFPQVTILERPEHLRADTIPMNEVLLYDASQVPGDFYLQTHSTNPLLRSETISRAIQNLEENFPAYDSLFSVTRLQVRLWDQLTRPINHNSSILLRTQDLPPVYAENSCLYIFRQETLVTHRNRIGERPLMYEIDNNEAWDIDNELDFSIAGFLIEQNKYLQNS